MNQTYRMYAIVTYGNGLSKMARCEDFDIRSASWVASIINTEDATIESVELFLHSGPIIIARTKVYSDKFPTMGKGEKITFSVDVQINQKKDNNELLGVRLWSSGAE